MTPFDVIKLSVKNVVIIESFMLMNESELAEFDLGQLDREKYNFYRSCKCSDLEYQNNSLPEIINIEYDRMLNKSKVFNKISNFISLIGGVCPGATTDMFEQFIENYNLCEKISDNEYFTLRERAKLELIKEALS